MRTFGEELRDIGGAEAPRSAAARLDELLAAEVRRGREQLALPRSGTRDRPIVVAFAHTRDEIRAVLPIDPGYRADIEDANEREALVAAVTVAGMVTGEGSAGGAGPALRCGTLAGGLLLSLPAGPPWEEDRSGLAVLHFQDRLAEADRLRIEAFAIPWFVLVAAEAASPPIGTPHPLHVAEAVARLGGEPDDPASVESLEEALSRIFQPAGAVIRAHDDPDPSRRAARRILQRLAGMGKWSGYHTAFEHLSRGFEGNDRALAARVGESLVDSGLLDQKRSVGQRHVFLNPRRAGDIWRLIEQGEVPPDLELP